MTNFKICEILMRAGDQKPEYQLEWPNVAAATTTPTAATTTCNAAAATTCCITAFSSTVAASATAAYPISIYW